MAAETLTAETKRKAGLGFWFLWLIANIGVWALVNLGGSFLEGIVSEMLIGFLIGLGIGAVQWLVLRNYLPNVVWWIAATTAAWGIGWASLIYMINEMGYGKYGFVIGAVLIGVLLGVGQWLVLNRQVKRTYLLIPVNMVAIGLGLSMGMSSTLGSFMLQGKLIHAATMGLGGMLYGVVSGFALLLLFEHPDWGMSEREIAYRKEQEQKKLQQQQQQQQQQES